MVRAVRDGEPIRSVAKRFGVSVGTVHFWFEHCRGERLDRCDFDDRKSGAPRPWNRVSIATERQVLSIRRELKERSVLGECGAPTIQAAMREQGRMPVPSVATISRILVRHGAVDGRARQRRPAPPRGWYLPPVAEAKAELDCFDIIEDLKLKDGPLFSVLTATSLHAGEVEAWPSEHIGAKSVVACLIQRWRELGLPGYAQFDNDTIFQGAHQWPDTLGRVIRLCLALQVTPVFAPPREPGFQNSIESFNGLWQAKVWQRFQFDQLAALVEHSGHYIEARRQRNAKRLEGAPPRRAFPNEFRFDPRRLLPGTVIYLRRTDGKGHLQLLGHRLSVHPQWVNRLVRCEVHLHRSQIKCFALRRRAPTEQTLLATLAYHWPDKPFKGDL
jgi:hypothetical protein